MSISLTDLETAISTLMVKEKIDYKEGDIEVNGSDHLLALIKLRESMLITSPDNELETIAFDFDINAMGVDNTQVEL